MRRALTVLLAASVAVSVTGQQNPTPTFRSDVNAVVLDVRVLDKDGRFVSGLTPGDLEIFEDGERQTISTFDLVEIPIHPDERPIFGGKPVDADVSSNERSEGRLYAILLDDLHTHPARSVTVQAVAREFIDRNFSEVDRAVVLTTSGRNDVRQEFTNNRARLIDLVNRFQGGFNTSANCGMVADPKAPAAVMTLSGRQAMTAMPAVVDEGACTVADDSAALKSLSSLANWLSSVNGRRKAIVFVSEGFDGRMSNAFDGAESAVDAFLDDLTGGSVTRAKVSNDAAMISGELRTVLESAARANVSIYPIDPNGLPGGQSTGVAPVPMLADDTPFDAKHLQNRLMLDAIARGTGGVALTRSNDFAGALDRVVSENSSYYLLGYVPTNGRHDGAFRKVEVRSVGPGLKVQSRTGYTAKNDPPAKRTSDGGPSKELTDLMGTPVQISGLPIGISAPAFIGRGSKTSVEVIAELPASELKLLIDPGHPNLALNLLIAVADTEGHVKASENGEIAMELSPGSRDALTRYGIRVMSRLEVAPGRYLLRVAGADGRTRGSVQYDLDVPDFTKSALTMSGLALASASELRRPTTGSDKNWKQRFAQPPTTVRTFTRDDELAVSGEIYANDKTIGAVEVVTSVQNESGAILFTGRNVLEGSRGKPSVRPHQAGFSLGSLDPGRYLLTVAARDAANPKTASSRQIPFVVR
jgi:VWFA-related protein